MMTNIATLFKSENQRDRYLDLGRDHSLLLIFALKKSYNQTGKINYLQKEVLEKPIHYTN